MRYREMFGRATLVVPKSYRKKIFNKGTGIFIDLKSNVTIMKHPDGSFNVYSLLLFKHIFRRALWI